MDEIRGLQIQNPRSYQMKTVKQVHYICGVCPAILGIFGRQIACNIFEINPFMLDTKVHNRTTRPHS